MVKELLLRKLARKQGQKLEEAKDFITIITSQNSITETKRKNFQKYKMEKQKSWTRFQ